jgi:hypothetical protein
MGTWRRSGGFNNALRGLMHDEWVTTQGCHSERQQGAKNLVYVYEINMVGGDSSLLRFS